MFILFFCCYMVLSCADKKVPQRSSRPVLHSLINCNRFNWSKWTRFRSNNTCFVVLKRNIACLLCNGRRVFCCRGRGFLLFPRPLWERGNIFRNKLFNHSPLKLFNHLHPSLSAQFCHVEFISGSQRHPEAHEQKVKGVSHTGLLRVRKAEGSP